MFFIMFKLICHIPPLLTVHLHALICLTLGLLYVLYFLSHFLWELQMERSTRAALEN